MRMTIGEKILYYLVLNGASVEYYYSYMFFSSVFSGMQSVLVMLEIMKASRLKLQMPTLSRSILRY